MKVVLLLAALLAVAFAQIYDPEEKRFVQFGPSEDEKMWLTVAQLDEIDQERHRINKLGVGYFDITDYQSPVDTSKVQIKRAFPTVPTQQSIVEPLLSLASSNNIRSTIANLSSFSTRYYTTTAGQQSSVWLRDTMQAFADAAGRNDSYCELYVHSGWLQNSVICTIEGSDLADEIIITGAHLDSVNSRSTPNGVAPGADDDATGVASFVETFRILVSNGFKPRRTLQFMAYAAEEVGLRGSQEIARAYVRDEKNVYAVYQNEMSGYVETTKAITVLQDYVDTSLTRFLEALVVEYTSLPIARAVCGYGCSDHASFSNLLIPAVCTAEAGPFGDVNPDMHTAQDTLDNLDMSFTLEFGKLALAFLVELSVVA